jgi:hypothetical protein
MRTLRLSDFLVAFLVAIIISFFAGQCVAQSWYSNQYKKNGSTSQLNSKTVAQKKLTVYQKHSNLYKIRREIAHSKKRKNFKKAKTR